jgi:glycosyltransferase involved in cell wall biosynthesis
MIPLLLDFEPEWRGGQNQFFLLLRGLYERGHAAELLSVKGSSLGHRAEKAGFCVHYTSRGRFHLKAAGQVRDLMRDGRIDLVHANESHALTAAWLARAHRRTPLLVSRRVGYPLKAGFFSQARFAAATKIIANSRWVAEQAAASGAPQDKLTVIYEGVDVPQSISPDSRRSARRHWNIGEGEKLVGCVGVLLEDKGHEWVIRALARLRDEFPHCKLLLAGDGSYRRRLQTIACELNLQDRVIFAGFIRDIELVYRAIDVFVFPSLFEGLGTSLLAAMAHAVPSVTYFGCALAEIVENGESGLQVEPRDPDRLASAMGRILRDGDFATQLGQAGRRRVEKVFSSERMVDQTVSLYRQLLQ